MQAPARGSPGQHARLWVSSFWNFLHVSSEMDTPVVGLPPNATFAGAIFRWPALQNLATRQPLHVSIGVSSWGVRKGEGGERKGEGQKRKGTEG